MRMMDAEEFGYSNPKLLISGEVAGIRPMIFTVGLFVGLDDIGYRTRFCYPNMQSAVKALEEWDGIGDPPGPWIKEKGAIERDNPNGNRSESIPGNGTTL